MIAGKDAARFGEAKNSWLTGTAAWTFTSISQYILGVRASFGGLTIDPCLPDSIKNLTITRKFRDAVYNITTITISTKEFLLLLSMVMKLQETQCLSMLTLKNSM